MQKPLTLSLIIPAYNEAAYLPRCLEAIVTQTIAPAEVIVVDNDSSDNTAEIASHFPFVKVVHESHQGVVFARDAGFNAATGDIIGRIDADTVVPSDWVEHVLDFYNSGNLDRAWTGGALYGNVRLPKIIAFIQHMLVFRLNRLLLGHHITWGSNMAVPRKLWQVVRSQVCHLSDIHEDIDLSIHLHRAGFKMVYQKRQLVNCRLRRVRSNRRWLWGNLQWWPRTLRVHGIKTWIFAWIIGVWLFYVLSFLPLAAEAVARAFGRFALPE